MALFSTLLSKSNGQDASTVSSSSSIPTVIQLYTSKAVILDPNDGKFTGRQQQQQHAILSYQAIEVVASSTTDGADDMFGRTRKTSNTATTTSVSPNLAVWNCCCLKSTSSSSTALIDQLLNVPDTASFPYFCFTVDLDGDLSQVEPTVSRLQEALVRLLIQRPPSPTVATSNRTTSLYDLRLNTFGLAPEDDHPPTTTSAPDQDDRNVKVSLLINVICHSSSTNRGNTNSSNDSNVDGDDYRKAQAQHLIMYHLRRFATAVNATLCFVRTTTDADKHEDEPSHEQLPTLTLTQLSHLWQDLAQGKELTTHNKHAISNNGDEEDGKEDDEVETVTAIYTPHQNQDLIETVLLRNAQCPGYWDASKDSLWVALPPPSLVAQETAVRTQTKSSLSGDEGWLSQLRDSMGAAAVDVAVATPTPTPKTDDAAVSSFFENLLKK